MKTTKMICSVKLKHIPDAAVPTGTQAERGDQCLQILKIVAEKYMKKGAGKRQTVR